MQHTGNTHVAAYGGYAYVTHFGQTWIKRVSIGGTSTAAENAENVPTPGAASTPLTVASAGIGDGPNGVWVQSTAENTLREIGGTGGTWEYRRTLYGATGNDDFAIQPEYLWLASSSTMFLRGVSGTSPGPSSNYDTISFVGVTDVTSVDDTLYAINSSGTVMEYKHDEEKGMLAGWERWRAGLVAAMNLAWSRFHLITAHFQAYGPMLVDTGRLGWTRRGLSSVTTGTSAGWRRFGAASPALVSGWKRWHFREAAKRPAWTRWHTNTTTRLLGWFRFKIAEAQWQAFDPTEDHGQAAWTRWGLPAAAKRLAWTRWGLPAAAKRLAWTRWQFLAPRVAMRWSRFYLITVHFQAYGPMLVDTGRLGWTRLGAGLTAGTSAGWRRFGAASPALVSGWKRWYTETTPPNRTAWIRHGVVTKLVEGFAWRRWHVPVAARNLGWLRFNNVATPRLAGWVRWDTLVETTKRLAWTRWHVPVAAKNLAWSRFYLITAHFQAYGPMLVDTGRLGWTRLGAGLTAGTSAGWRRFGAASPALVSGWKRWHFREAAKRLAWTRWHVPVAAKNLAWSRFYLITAHFQAYGPMLVDTGRLGWTRWAWVDKSNRVGWLRFRYSTRTRLFAWKRGELFSVLKRIGWTRWELLSPGKRAGWNRHGTISTIIRTFGWTRWELLFLHNRPTWLRLERVNLETLLFGWTRWQFLSPARIVGWLRFSTISETNRFGWTRWWPLRPGTSAGWTRWGAPGPAVLAGWLRHGMSRAPRLGIFKGTRNRRFRLGI